MGLAYSLRGLVHYHHSVREGHTSRHGTVELYIESSTSRSTGSRKRRCLVWAFETSKPTAGDTHPPIKPHLLILLVFSNSIIPWWLSIQIYEPIGPFLFKSLLLVPVSNKTPMKFIVLSSSTLVIYVLWSVVGSLSEESRFIYLWVHVCVCCMTEDL